jgi:hypothetical protein
MGFRPDSSMSKHGFSDRVIVNAFKKSDHAIPATAPGVGKLIIGDANRANRVSLSPGDKKICHPALEKRSASRIDKLQAFGY